MRLFIAIDFHTGLKQQIRDVQRKLRDNSIKGRWKHSDNFHVTLRFLGETPSNTVADIENAMRVVCRQVHPFSLRIQQLGYFAGKDCFRVLWLGMDGETNALQELNKRLEASLQQIGYPPETRPFRPHITLGQDVVTEKTMEQLQTIISTYEFETLYVHSFVLYKSEQIGRQRVYTPLFEARLGDED